MNLILNLSLIPFYRLQYDSVVRTPQVREVIDFDQTCGESVETIVAYGICEEVGLLAKSCLLHTEIS